MEDLGTIRLPTVDLHVKSLGDAEATPLEQVIETNELTVSIVLQDAAEDKGYRLIMDAREAKAIGQSLQQAATQALGDCGLD